MLLIFFILSFFKVFLYMLKMKLQELGIPFNVEEIITDFELNIHKSIDEVLTSVYILGCLFHFAKAIKKKLDRKGMKCLYDNNCEFRRFVKKVVALSSLPLQDLEEGFEILNRIQLEDETANESKALLMTYIEDYWMNGCYPPFVWNTWGRTDDYTNNNQVVLKVMVK